MNEEIVKKGCDCMYNVDNDVPLPYLTYNKILEGQLWKKELKN